MARVWIGTSGFSYKEWKGQLYPPDLPADQMLAYYGSRFNSVEIDSTFYRMPSPETLQKWAGAVPTDFRFTIKSPQQITHRERLKVPSAAVERLTSIVGELGDRLGLLCFQLPPFLKANFSRLEAFLSSLPPSPRYVFEFRHESWYGPETYQILRDHQASLCIHDADEGTSPTEVMGTAVYVRLRRSSYDAASRLDWCRRFRDWSASGVEVFAYIKHKDNPEAPTIALAFAEHLGR